ncbi:Ferric uptake regulation protein [Planctomycetes bacterium Poly30]|uniref:Ferric uptake regulation protein n=1 Tax=Saltatorellus ferox TaxID=2528018 RepID=A0A518EU24_9BACT|nr:Ferric uptake regulation protein [Planctomycetes bacterium Poly30]
MNETAIEKRFEEFLKGENLKMTPQRRRVFEKAFAVHDHFSVERMYEWLKAEEGPAVSRATVYRTLEVLERGGFIEAVETGRGEVVYEHILGHEHHDHMVCRICGTIAEFQDEQIEALQRKNAKALGFIMTGHMLRLSGICSSCADQLRAEGKLESTLENL